MWITCLFGWNLGLFEDFLTTLGKRSVPRIEPQTVQSLDQYPMLCTEPLGYGDPVHAY